MLKLKEKSYQHAMLAILGTVGIIVVLTFRHYGITWDEELQSQYGLAVVDYYASLGADQRYQEIFNLFLYGGMFDGLASVIDSFTPFRVYETRHLVNAVFGLLGLWGTWRLTRFIGGGAAGLIAFVLLLLTPMYYGHMFNNPKDIPFAAGVVWAMYYMVKSVAELPRIRQRTIIKLGIIYGLTLGIRVGGLMELLFWIAAVEAQAFLPLVVAKPWWKKLRPDAKNFLAWRKATGAGWSYGWRLILPAMLIAYVVMLACWPWAQQNPILNPLHAFNEFRHFPQDVEIMLDGTIYRSTELPWYYVPLYFAVQLPEILLFLIAASIPLTPRILRKLAPSKRLGFVMVAMMAFLPILYAVVGHPALYDAVRHFLFTVPLMCVVAGLAARSGYTFAVGAFRKAWARDAVAIALFGSFTVAVAPQIALMVALHPYEYIYVNAFAGGVPGAFGHYELDYWGSSFKEAAKRIETLVAREGGVPPGKIYRIAICGPWDSAMIYLPPDYEPVVADQPAEFFLDHALDVPEHAAGPGSHPHIAAWRTAGNREGFTEEAMSVSYLITLYNKQDYIGGVLDAVLDEMALTGGEIVIYDDASTDRSAEIVEQRIKARPDQPVRLVRGEQNRGVGFATNYLIAVAAKPYTRLVDGDDVLVKGSTAHMLRLLIEHRLDFIHGWTTEVGNEPDGLDRQPFADLLMIDTPVRQILRHTIAGASPSLFITEVLRAAAPVPAWIKRTQDFLITLRVANRGARMGYVKDIVSIGPSNRTGNNLSASLAAMFGEMSRDVAHDGLVLPLDDLRYASRRYAGRAIKYYRRQGRSKLSTAEKLKLWGWRHFAWLASRQACIAHLTHVADILDRDRDVLVTGPAR